MHAPSAINLIIQFSLLLTARVAREIDDFVLSFLRLPPSRRASGRLSVNPILTHHNISLRHSSVSLLSKEGWVATGQNSRAKRYVSVTRSPKVSESLTLVCVARSNAWNRDPAATVYGSRFTREHPSTSTSDTASIGARSGTKADSQRMERRYKESTGVWDPKDSALTPCKL
jgi:hypothetical protein